MTSIATRAYFAAPVWLQNVMISAYGLRLRRLRYGRVQREALAALCTSQWLPREELQALQLRELNRVIALARETVPLYAGRGLPDRPLSRLEEIRRLPLLTKEELQQPAAMITSSRSRGVRLEEVHTGGTTGKPLTIYCDRGTLQRNYAFFARFREWAGVQPDARVATFAGRTLVPPTQESPPYWRRNAAANSLLFSSYHISPRTVEAYVKALEAFRPALIDSYPSSLEPIARHILNRGGTSHRPAAIITSSETLIPEVRELIERAFSTRIFDHYGAAEMAALVTQCEAGSYHVNSEFGIIEVLRDGQPVGPGESGDLVATGFINPVMPLIRYATGDTAVQGDGTCRCGRALPTLLGLEGRRDDVLITPDGRRIGRLDPIFKAVSSLHETRIVQDAPDHVRVEMVLHDDLPAEDAASLRRELANRLGPLMRVDLVRVSQLPRTARGKLRSVVNEVG
jgi:phenylacetate-CoA ligase